MGVDAPTRTAGSGGLPRPPRGGDPCRARICACACPGPLLEPERPSATLTGADRRQRQRSRQHERVPEATRASFRPGVPGRAAGHRHPRRRRPGLIRSPPASGGAGVKRLLPQDRHGYRALAPTGLCLVLAAGRARRCAHVRFLGLPAVMAFFRRASASQAQAPLGARADARRGGCATRWPGGAAAGSVAVTQTACRARTRAAQRGVRCRSSACSGASTGICSPTAASAAPLSVTPPSAYHAGAAACRTSGPPARDTGSTR